jgi:hypothetical protein
MEVEVIALSTISLVLLAIVLIALLAIKLTVPPILLIPKLRTNVVAVAEKIGFLMIYLAKKK